jgi:hypothetical protein
LSGSPGYEIFGCAMTFAASGLCTGTLMTEIFSCVGLSPVVGPQEGPRLSE